MKNILNLIFKMGLLFSFLAAFTSCDLELQDTFEFNDELGPEITFDNQTVWEWLQTQKSPTDTIMVDDKFDLLIQAIEMTGMIEEYNQTTTNERTYLLLNNAAFIGDNDIIEVVTGEQDGDLADADLRILKNLLSYHIVTSYVDQVPTLFEYGVDYQFQTLIPGEDGEIYFRRDERYAITVNGANQLPASARQVGVFNHNYVFQNGIGHHLNGYTRSIPFE